MGVVGELVIVSRIARHGRNRFVLNLPSSLNPVWKKLHGRKVEVRIKVVEES